MDFEFYMRRALELARHGEGFVSPNPMVGAVIVAPDGRIIGEGWHRRYGEAHAEVNACNAVSEQDLPLLSQSTIFVTLEPCAHYGKTPPCARLLIEKGFHRVVVGTRDPFEKVNGCGLSMIADAGIEVVEGVLERECRDINKTFFFAHLNKRPYITLKWAQSADGWMDSRSSHPYRFSTPLSQIQVHKLRGCSDAVVTSTSTVIADNPHLNVRHWPCRRNPLKVVIGETPVPAEANIFKDGETVIFNNHDIEGAMRSLYKDYGVTSVIVEGGPVFLNAFIGQGLWNEARIEVNPVNLGDDGLCAAPSMPGVPDGYSKIDCNTVFTYKKG